MDKDLKKVMLAFVEKHRVELIRQGRLALGDDQKALAALAEGRVSKGGTTFTTRIEGYELTLYYNPYRPNEIAIEHARGIVPSGGRSNRSAHQDAA